MSGISDGQRVNAANSNAAWIAKNGNDSTIGILTINNTTTSTTKDTGALVVEGGVGIEENLNVGGNAVITGNLTVNGTTTTISTTNLDIEDALININDGGSDATSEGAGIQIERTTTNAQILFEDALTSKFKMGLVGALYEVVTSGIASTIAGAKTFSSAIAMGANKITGLGAGTALTDAVNKAQLDADGGHATITTSGGTTALSSTSAQITYFSGAANHTIDLPDTTTLTIGQLYEIINFSTGLIFCRSSGGGALFTLAAGQKLIARVDGTSGSSDWSAYAVPMFNAGNTAIDAASKKISNVTDPTSAQDAATKNYVDTAGLTNPMTTGGDIIYGGASGVPTRLANGTAGQVLQSNGTTVAPSWTSTPTLTAPTVQRFTSGSGTYTTPANVKYIQVEMVGGGGGGGGGAQNSAATTGGSTTFGSSLLTAAGGAGGACGNVANSGANGGAPTINAPAISLISLDGGVGGSGQLGVTNGLGGSGGVSVYGGNPGSIVAQEGNSAKTNSGSGGGGGSVSSTVNAGHGGGSGAYVKALISSPSATYSYAVGASGAGASAGASGYAGGAGGSGIIIVTEYYY